jgi:phospholipid/cholesterol/gamma-HCH transport system permease protein
VSERASTPGPMRRSRSSLPPPPPTLGEQIREALLRWMTFIEHAGGVAVLARQAMVRMVTGRFEMRLFVYQMEQLGVRSLGIAAATAVFVGIVMSIQFAFSLEKFGARDTVGRIVALSEVRELAPALTALVVGSRIGAGMAAEIGSMKVTEQIDAIRALGADPIRKLVIPRIAAGVVVMPLLTCFALVLGFFSAMVVSNLSFGVSMSFFLTSGLDVVTVRDLASGMGKTPVFGFLIALLGCYFGLGTTGGTEGVGQSTTSAVVVVSIAVLMADALLTQLFMHL